MSLLATASVAAQPAGGPVAEVIARRSVESLNTLPDDSERLLERNLPRYFVAFPLLADAENRQGVLNAALRATARFSGGVLMRGLAATSESGPAHLDAASVHSAARQALPRERTPWGETVYFPSGAAVVVEDWDQRVMDATGTPWAALGLLVQQPIPERLAASTLDDAAAEALAEEAGAFALLILRLAGEQARDGLDSYVQPHHVSQAMREFGGLADASPGRPTRSGSHFTDVTEAAGVGFRHVSSEWISRFRRWGEDAPTFSGGGVAARDLDGDDRVDLVLCGGAGCTVWKNDGLAEGAGFPRFRDVTESAGLGDDYEARMPLAADFDGDGDQDLLVTVARDGSRLYRNDSTAEGIRFADVTEPSGLSRPGDVAGPAVAFDSDLDGDLDLYVGNFGDYLGGASPWLSPDSRNGQPNRLFRNVGDGGGESGEGDGENSLRFEEVDDPEAADTGWSQAVSHLDFDGDGDQDLYVANDFGRNELLANRGDGSFERVGAATASDDPFHGMNAAFADLNRDRLPDVLVTNIWTMNVAENRLSEANSLLLSRSAELSHTGTVSFENRSVVSGMTAADTGWSWGALFFDADHDGLDDLLVLTGLHDYNTFFQWRRHPQGEDHMVPITHRREPNVFYRGLSTEDGVPRFEVVEDSGAELPGLNGRALALADLDRDGDLDAVISHFHDGPRILRNDAPKRGRWLEVEIEGRGTVSRDAVGTVVVATAPNVYAWRMASGGEGYLATSQRPLHFGVGSADTVTLDVTWPGGARETFSDVPTNRRVRIRRGSTELEIR